MSYITSVASSVCRYTLLLSLFSAGVAHSQATGDIAIVAVSGLKPTQAFIAHDQVNYKLHRYLIDRRKLFDDLCEIYGRGDRAEITGASIPQALTSFSCRLSDETGFAPDTMKTAVLGPGGLYYLTDGHHTFSTFHDFAETGTDFEVPVRVTHDQSALSPTAFWQWMQENRLTWLQDADGVAVTPQQLPAQLGRDYLGNDVWRGAMYFLRDQVWVKPEPAVPFVEFYWAQHLRQYPRLQPPILDSAESYLLWLERLGGHMLAISEQIAIGPQGQPPDDLGRLSDVERYDLSILLCDGDEVGKLALALAARGVVSNCLPYGHKTDAAPILSNDALTDDAENLLTAVIEIPAGSNEKWQMAKNAPGTLEWERADGVLRVIDYLPYPANYGALPGTLMSRDAGGDGDPLDVLVLGPALPRGATVAVRVIGQLSMLDDGERDDKLIAVVPQDTSFGSLRDVAGLQTQFPGVSDILMSWFQNYKGEAGNVSELALQPWQP